MSTSSPEAVKKLLENMQTDLRSLSMECKKKFPPVKEAAESGIVKIKTIAARNTDILAGRTVYYGLLWLKCIIVLCMSTRCSSTPIKISCYLIVFKVHQASMMLEIIKEIICHKKSY
uniref:Mon2/Sec7/BIG1-like dimerisation and cyclophilin-binding domain-containing protein n=1 Tax=Astyanax mexicanus TaxID=7994 RepID=A0A8B9GX64_ASTMX